MKNINHNQIEDLLRQAKGKFRLSHQDKADIKTSFMKKVKNTSLAGDSRASLIPSRSGIRMLAPALMAVVIAIGSGTAALANSAKPGDALYSVDQLMEKIESTLVTNPNTKAQLYASFSEERAKELAELADDQDDDSSDKAKDARREAETGVANSIERVNRVATIFEDKISAETDDHKKEVFRKVLDHLRASENRRNELLDRLEAKHGQDQGESSRTSEGKSRFRFEVSPEAKSKILDEVDHDFNPGTDTGSGSGDDDNGSGDSNSGSGSGSGDSTNSGSGDSDDDKSRPCDADHTIPDPNFPGMCYGNNSLIQSGVNQILNN